MKKANDKIKESYVLKYIKDDAEERQFATKDIGIAFKTFASQVKEKTGSAPDRDALSIFRDRWSVCICVDGTEHEWELYRVI